MTDMEMRWAKMLSKSDCLISSDVYGYLYFGFGEVYEMHF
jgi:hypothetical protein